MNRRRPPAGWRLPAREAFAGFALASSTMGSWCGPSCDDEPVCRTFDAMAWCETAGDCSPTGAANPGHFSVSEQPQSVVLPVSDFADSVDGMTWLKVWFESNRSVSPDVIHLVLDGVAPTSATCSVDERTSLTYWCRVTSELSTLEIQCDHAAFSVDVHVEFSEDVCTESEEVCLL